MKPVQQRVSDYLSYNGITRGVKETEVRPRVSGYLDRILFKADSQVKAGDLLFVIDQRPYKVAVERAEAELKGKRAAVESTLSNLERVKRLAVQQAASEQELIDRQAAYDLAVADVGVAEAELNEAKLNLAFTEVRAPISGRVSRNLLDEGTLLRINEQILATIVNDDQIYVDFQVSEAEYLDYLRKNPKARTEKASEMEPVVVELGMADEVGYSRRGRVVAADNTIDRATATLGVRAIFDNPDKQIAPGLYVRIRTVMGDIDATLVPDVAVQADQRGEYVLVVGEKDLIERRQVHSGARSGAYRRIIDGVTLNDRIVVNGLQRARPGAPVAPVDVKGPPLPDLLPATQPALSAAANSAIDAATQPTTVPATQPKSPEAR